ncbi:MAG: NAD-dependent epimerase/dehydratase family protein [Candidatus Entotheonellia bacterium]
MDLPTNLSSLAGQRVLVTGGTGFIGGRLVEKLVLECQAQVRVLLRNFTRALRIARFPVEMVYGDVLQAEDVERAARGCDVIFHCAYGNSGSPEAQRSVNVQGTQHVLDAVLHTGITRVVHLSTLMVYGRTPEGDLDESAPRRYWGDVYADSKLDAEKLACEYVERYRLPVVVLQPGGVYGPFAAAWTMNVLKSLKKGRVILVDGGEGLCNAVYVDDVVSAMLLAAVQRNAVGETFLVAGAQPVTWKEFFTRYERMLGLSRTVCMSAAEAEAYYARNQRKVGLLGELSKMLRAGASLQGPLFRTPEVAACLKVARALTPKPVRNFLKRQLGDPSRAAKPQATSDPEPSIQALPPVMVQLYRAKTRVRIDKARAMLHYEPAFDFEKGMHVTEQWARWSGWLDG